jgi:hypothetical protein
MAKTLEERLDAIESIEQIKKLKYQYCRYCDLNYDKEGIASLFVEDGIWQMGRDDINVGQEAIRRKFDGMSNDIPFAAHLVLNPMIEVDGDTATGRWWLTMPCTRRVNGELAGYWLVGQYEEEYVRVKGAWKFKKLYLEQSYWTPHLQDWALESLRK